MKRTIRSKSIGRRGIASVILGIFLLTSGIAPVRYAYGQEAFQLPHPGTRISLSTAFEPALLKGVKVYLDNPFRLDFILNKGNSSDSTDELKSEAARLIKYFLASITVPEQDLWVNLSPYEKDRIVPEAFGVTEMGRDLLAQDYILKQITASVIYPEEKIGKEFWDKVYAEAQKRYGTTDVPVDTFNKVWIAPEKAVVYESKDSAYVVESHLKVMLETDYLAQKFGILPARSSTGRQNDNDLAKQILREVVVPILEKEVNEGKNFAQLRQVYHSLILAVWYKDKVKETLFGKAYVDQKKTSGVDIDDKTEKDKIWAQYVEAFKKGVYNYIKEDFDPATQQTLPRKYFSGGITATGLHQKLIKLHDSAMLPESVHHRDWIVQADLAMDASGNRIPFLKGTYSRLIDWQITERCQLNCKHCYGKGYLQEPAISQFGKEELSFEDKLRIVDLLFTKGIRIIAFSGGEPTLAPRIDELCAYARSRGMRVVINTNGLQFKKNGEDFFIEILGEGRTLRAVALKDFLHNVDQINFSLDTVDPLSFRGDLPARLPEIIRHIKTICKRREKDMEVQITTTITRENMERISTDVFPYVRNIIVDVLSENNVAATGVTIMPPIWKLNIFRPNKKLGQRNDQLGLAFDEYSRIYEFCLTSLRASVRQHYAGHPEQIHSLTEDQMIRVNKHWEDASYKYLMIMPNGVLVTIVEDMNNKSHGFGLQEYKVVGYLDKNNPWVYENLAETIARKVSDKLRQLSGRVYEAAVGVTGKGDDVDKAPEGDADPSAANLGGIDLNPSTMDMAIKSSGGTMGLSLDPAMLERMQNAAGLTPVVIDIQPMTTTVLMFLGFSEKEENPGARAVLQS